MCKIVQKVKNCAKCTKMCKMRKTVPNMQNVQNCVKCTNRGKCLEVCKMFKIVENVQNCAKLYKIVQNVQNCAKLYKGATLYKCANVCKICIIVQKVYTIGCFTKTCFWWKKIGSTRSASIWGLVWRNPKGFLILTSFRGCTSHFRFDLFYIVDFHSALTLPDRVTAESKSTM